MDNYDLRFSEESDLAFLQSCFQSEADCHDFPFSFEEKDDALKNWIGFSRYKASLTGTIDNQPCSIGTLFLMPYRKVAHHCSFFIVVHPEHRRKGLGVSMVRNLLNLAKTRFRLECLHVEIYEQSPMLPLLNKCGFHSFVRQEDFVKENGLHRARILLEHWL
jgi:RimJ/RimL family protein N-acetyltransferase